MNSEIKPLSRYRIKVLEYERKIYYRGYKDALRDTLEHMQRGIHLSEITRWLHLNLRNIFEQHGDCTEQFKKLPRKRKLK